VLEMHLPLLDAFREPVGVMSRQDTVGEFGIGPGSNRQTVRTAHVSSQFGPAPAQLDLPLTPSWEIANGIALGL
jgi:hypothetical protein